jgi:hypothetical protein
MIMGDPVQCSLSNGFSVWEKLYAQGLFYAVGIIGMIGIARADWPWLVPYLILYGYGVPGIVMRHLACPRCPHLFVYGDCLQFPPTWAKWLVKQRKTTPFSATEKWVFYLIFLLILIYPLFWLQTQPALLVVFTLTAGMWYFGQRLYFCKRCRVEACPFNRAPVQLDSHNG